VFCAFGLAINYIDRSAISVSLPFMTQDFHLTATEKGLVLSAFSWSYALMQLPAGRLIDRFGECEPVYESVPGWSEPTAGATSYSALPKEAKAYLRRLRLEEVRAELVAADPSQQTVVAVAARWGFHHHGRMTAAYRELYGELPSTTLAG